MEIMAGCLGDAGLIPSPQPPAIFRLHKGKAATLLQTACLDVESYRLPLGQ